MTTRNANSDTARDFIEKAIARSDANARQRLDDSVGLDNTLRSAKANELIGGFWSKELNSLPARDNRDVESFCKTRLNDLYSDVTRSIIAAELAAKEHGDRSPQANKAQNETMNRFVDYRRFRDECREQLGSDVDVWVTAYYGTNDNVPDDQLPPRNRWNELEVMLSPGQAHFDATLDSFLQKPNWEESSPRVLEVQVKSDAFRLERPETIDNPGHKIRSDNPDKDAVLRVVDVHRLPVDPYTDTATGDFVRELAQKKGALLIADTDTKEKGDVDQRARVKLPTKVATPKATSRSGGRRWNPGGRRR